MFYVEKINRRHKTNTGLSRTEHVKVTFVLQSILSRIHVSFFRAKGEEKKKKKKKEKEKEKNVFLFRIVPFSETGD